MILYCLLGIEAYHKHDRESKSSRKKWECASDSEDIRCILTFSEIITILLPLLKDYIYIFSRIIIYEICLSGVPQLNYKISKGFACSTIKFENYTTYPFVQFLLQCSTTSVSFIKRKSFAWKSWRFVAILLFCKQNADLL